ncbi:hypothetical protein HDU67_005818 [Dinochytrium kinnereticum]|nr:hypothetical protein HDU67_005818 [Dinochytrium kinnereticum]
MRTKGSLPSGRQLEKTNLVDDELHDLKLRFELLEGDRKAYYETSQWAIRQNKEEIGGLRGINKELSEAIARLKKNEVDFNASRMSMTELEKLDHRICEIHKRYDELQAEARMKEGRLREMRDQLADLKRESEMVKGNLQDSPQAKEIRMLENRLDKAMIKYNEAQSIRKTYEHIVKRLQEERLSFDNQLANFEKCLKSKKQDALELEMMSRDANHAKEVAKAELARFEQQINEERKQRERDLQTRKELVKQKMEINDKLDRKSLQLDDPNADLGLFQDPNKDHYDEVKEKKMAEYEEIMRLIKEATGVSNINEVIAKFQSQGDTHNHLSQLQKQNEARIEELKAKKSEILADFEDLKYTGESKNFHSQRTIEEFQTHLLDAQIRMQDAKHKYERLAKLLVNTKAGIQHLCDKLDTFQLQFNLEVKPDKSPKPPSSDSTIKQVLDFCTAKLEMLANGVQGKELPEPPGEPVNILQINPTSLPAYNTRVKLRPVEFEEEILDEEDENDDEYGEVPDRETIKKHTNQMINARLKTKQAKKTKKKKAMQYIFNHKIRLPPAGFNFTLNLFNPTNQAWDFVSETLLKTSRSDAKSLLMTIESSVAKDSEKLAQFFKLGLLQQSLGHWVEVLAKDKTAVAAAYEPSAILRNEGESLQLVESLKDLNRREFQLFLKTSPQSFAEAATSTASVIATSALGFGFNTVVAAREKIGTLPVTVAAAREKMGSIGKAASSSLDPSRFAFNSSSTMDSSSSLKVPASSEASTADSQKALGEVDSLKEEIVQLKAAIEEEKKQKFSAQVELVSVKHNRDLEISQLKSKILKLEKQLAETNEKHKIKNEVAAFREELAKNLRKQASN